MNVFRVAMTLAGVVACAACATPTSTTPSDEPETVSGADVAPTGDAGGAASGDGTTPAGPLAVSAVIPSSGRPFGGELVIVSGAGFVAGANVRFGGVEAPGLEVIDPTSLKVLTPPLPAGSHDVEVVVPGGQSAVLEAGFHVGGLGLAYGEVPSYAFPGLKDKDSQAAVAHDWDGDGDQDLVIVADGLPVLLRGDGNGNFTLPAAPPPPIDADAGSTDGDADGGPTDGETAEDAGPLPPVEEPPPPARAAVALDLNADGCLDLVTTHEDRWRSYAGNCAGDLVAADSLLPDDPGNLGVILAGDVNGDGVLDLLVADRDAAPGTSNRLYLGAAKTGVYVRADATWMPPHAEATAALALADVNGDGLPDLIAGNLSADDALTLRLLLQSGGRFVDAPDGMMPNGDGPVTALAAADVDADGDVDLVVVRPGAQDRLLRNDGQGFFFDDTLASMPVDVSDGVHVVVRDLDMDGDPDMLIANDMQQDRLYLSASTDKLQDHTPLLPLLLDPTRAIVPFDADGDGDLDLLFLEGPGVPNRLILCVEEGKP